MLLDTVRKTIKEYDMLKKGDRVLCAVSGGADSVCLLYVMLSLKEEYNLSLYVANVNHLIRGEEATRDSDFVKNLCRAEGIECFYREYDVPSISKERKMGEEECGRALRYEFFSEISQRLDVAKIATAHNLNDNAETILFRLIRGSSSQGLCGIRYKRENIIRPLLDVTRREIESFLREKNIKWCEDSTNSLAIYNRNKLRLSVFPHLDEISGDAQRKIVSAARILKDEDELLSLQADEIIKNCFFDNCIVVKDIEIAHISLKRRIALAILEKWNTKEVTSSKIEAFLDFISKESGKCFDINAEFFAEKSNDKVYLRKRQKEDFFQYLDEDKYLCNKDWTLRISRSAEPIKKKGNNIAVFDADKLGLPLTVRYRRDGDKILQSGMQSAKKLSDIFTDEKVDRPLRDITPIIIKDKDILFVCGLRQSSLYGVDSATKNYLVIEYNKTT